MPPEPTLEVSAMKHDELVHALGRLAKAQAAEEPAALAAAAEGRPLPSDQPAADETLARLLAPASPERLDAITAAALAELRAPAALRPTMPPANAPRPRRRSRIVTTALALGLVAGGVMLAVVGPPFRGEGLPPYQLEVTGGTETTRGAARPDPEAPIVLRGNATLELVLRPQKPYPSPVTARVFLVVGRQESVWSATMEVAPSGAVHLVGPVPVPPAPGEGELLVVLSRPADLPAHPPTSIERRDLIVLRRPIIWR